VVETVVHEFGLIFLAVNEVESKDERQREFIRLADDMVRRYYLTQARDTKEQEYLVQGGES
jgi:hypothetical protein